MPCVNDYHGPSSQARLHLAGRCELSFLHSVSQVYQRAIYLAAGNKSSLPAQLQPIFEGSNCWEGCVGKGRRRVC